MTVISLPFNDQELVLGVGGEIGAFGIKAYYNEGTVNIGFSSLVGGNVIIGIR